MIYNLYLVFNVIVNNLNALIFKMFDFISQYGDHKTFNYNTTKHQFREYFETLFGTTDLENLHTTIDCERYLDGSDTELHKTFYSDIKANGAFKTLYTSFVKDIYVV